MTIIPPQAKSWIEVDRDSQFPIQNIPFGVANEEDEPYIVTRVGDTLIDLKGLALAGLLRGDPEMYSDLETLLDEEGATGLSEVRKQLFLLFETSNPALRDSPKVRSQVLHPAEGAPMTTPMEVRSFTDFFSGIHHAERVGGAFRAGKDPLPRNYRFAPLAYTGRASSVVVSGVPIRRPYGQCPPTPDAEPIYSPTRELDFETEIGFFVADDTEWQSQVPIAEAERHIAGFVLLNDWSARDVQRWESNPMGPFLAKSFATTISPWLITLDALEPFRCDGQEQTPPPPDYLKRGPKGMFDITLEIWLRSAKMTKPQRVCQTKASDSYWSVAQQLTYMASNGCPLERGDLMGSGSISGVVSGSLGTLLEATAIAGQPLVMQETGEQRWYLEDGDTVTLVGYCQGNGYLVGFGEATARIEPAERS